MPTLRRVRHATAQAPAKDCHSEVPDVGSCRELFLAVIALAVRDAGTLRDLDGKPNITASQRKAVRQLTEDGIAPHEFFESEWFETMCALVSIHPETIRVRV